MAQTVAFLQAIATEIADDNIELVLQTMETLVEFAQGNHKNQEVIFDAAVTDDVNSILRNKDFPDCSEEEVGSPEC